MRLIPSQLGEGHRAPDQQEHAGLPSRHQGQNFLLGGRRGDGGGLSKYNNNNKFLQLKDKERQVIKDKFKVRACAYVCLVGGTGDG